MMMMGKMVMGGYKARKFAGLRTGELKSAPNKNEKTVDGWWKALRDPGEESSLELSRVCKGRMEDSSEDETDTEWGKKWEEHKKEREAEEAKEKLEEAQPWPTGMAGEWTIDLRQSSTDTEAGSMTIHEDTNSDGSIRQYWTEFQFGDNWRGMMRLCPMGSFEEDSEIKVEDFEKACILKEGVEAGPPPGNVNQWLMKWRGSLVKKYLPDSMRKDEPRDNMTTSITFKCGEDGRLSLSGVLLEGCIFRLFEGVRVGDGTPREPSAPKLEMLWNDKKFKEPRPPALWPWRSPIPSECVESPPAWAWDVIGKWKIDALEVAASLKAKKNDLFTMEIHMANSKKPVSLGRQLWATFKVGPKVLGCIRFIPLPEDSRPMDTVPAFEKACKLKKNIWPGHERSAPGKSYHKWGLRWRAKRTTGKSDYGRSDLYETMFNFERDEDGTLRVSGVWTIDSQMQLWKGVKIEDGPQVDGTETTVNAVWKSFAAK